MSVYKACDIRGPVDQLSEKLYRSWGRSIGRQAGSGAKVVAGGDVRLTTPAFLEAVVEGLVGAGAEVIELGIVSTPMVYFAKRFLGAEGCVIVTSSHNPPDTNGLKWMVGNLPPGPEDVQQLREEAEGADSAGRFAGQAVGRRTKKEIGESYLAWLRSSFGKRGDANMRVVLDPGGGSWCSRGSEYFDKVFGGMRVSAIHDKADGNFRERNPDSAKPENLGSLCQAVIEEGADIGIAFDGDGDRVGFVDNEGVALTAEQATWVLLGSWGQQIRGKNFVYDIKFSDVIRRAAEELGAIPTVERSGHAFIRTKMIQTAAVFGAEISGHYFYGQLDGGDDGLYTAMLMTAYLSGCGERLSELRRECPKSFITPDLRLRASTEKQTELIELASKAFGEYPQSRVDGVRIDFPDGWVLLRNSVTESSLTVRFEGQDGESLERIVKRGVST